MPRPKTKEELLYLSNANYEKLISFIENLSTEQQQKEFPSGTMNRNICDVLAHLHHWHLMMLRWYREGMAGQKPAMPEKGYSWKTVPELNRKIWEVYNQLSIKEVRERFSKSHEEVYQLIKKHSNKELFEKKRYSWTGSTSLGAYLISATSSHYDWALKLIRKATKGW